MKRILSLMCVLMIVFQSFGIHTYAEEERFYSEYALISECKLWVHYGSRAYGYFKEVGDTAVKCMTDTSAGADDSAVIDFNMSDNPVDLSTYKYMAIKYYRTGDYSAVKIKSFFTDDSNDTRMEYGKSNEWYTLVVDLGESSADKLLKQLHITMYPDMSNAALLEAENAESCVYIKSMGFYEYDPRSDEEKAESETLKAAAQNIRGTVQEYGIFKELEQCAVSNELLKNPSMDNTDNWAGSNSSIEISDAAYEGEGCIKVTNRDTGIYYSGIKQDITEQFREYKAGYYKFGAYIRCDENSPIIGKKYDIRIGISRYGDDGKKTWTYYYSSYTISDEWQKNENTVYIPWDDDNCISASFIIFGGDSSEKIHSDFYADKCSLIKYDVGKDEAKSHSAYIFPDEEGKFYPERSITGKELKDMLEICTGNEYTELNTDKEISGSQLMDYVPSDIDYSDRETVTRAEAVHLINAAQHRYPSETSYSCAVIKTFTDVDKSYWAYADITEAASEHNAYIYGAEKKSEIWEITEKNYNNGAAERRSEEIYAQSQLKKRSILNAGDCLDIKGQKYYFSNNGSDDNTGTSPEQPFASMDKLMSLKLNEGDGVLFERGSIWRGVSLSCVSGVTYGAYGSGQKPIFYGSKKDYADPQLWQETEIENVWETTELIDGSAGFISFNNGERFALKVSSEADLTGEYTFYDGTMANSKIKLYCTQNPGNAYSNIEIAPGKSIINGVKKENCVFDNLCLMYTGWHGFRFSSVDNITVTNCEIGYIGGTGESARWGNGIEIWNTSDNVLIKDNYVYQIYDTALTNQYSGVSDKPSVQSNIVYEGNLIEYSTYGFEFFSNQTNSNMDIMKNITVKDNIIAYTGCGWGQENRNAKDTTAAIKGWSAKNRSENFVIEDNVFYKSAVRDFDWSCFAYNLDLKKLITSNKTPQYMPELDGNIFAGTLGGEFGEFNGESYSFDYSINHSMAKYIDANAETVLLSDLKTDEEFSIAAPVIAVENDCAEIGNTIVAVCTVPENDAVSDKSINLILCLYDGIKERAIDICRYNHLKNADAAVISAEIEIPDGIYENCEIRAYVLDDNMKRYADTAIVKYSKGVNG